MSQAELVCISVVDVREGGAVRHAVDARARALALRDDCVTWLPRAARMLLPAMDALTRRWLQRSHSPYVMDLEAIAVALGFPGIWFLNGTYQWGCTAVARDEAQHACCKLDHLLDHLAPPDEKSSLMTFEYVKNVARRASDQLRRRRGTPSRAGRQHDVAPAFELS